MFGKRRQMSHDSRRPTISRSRSSGMVSPPPWGISSPLMCAAIADPPSPSWFVPDEVGSRPKKEYRQPHYTGVGPALESSHGGKSGAEPQQENDQPEA